MQQQTMIAVQCQHSSLAHSPSVAVMNMTLPTNDPLMFLSQRELYTTTCTVHCVCAGRPLMVYEGRCRSNTSRVGTVSPSHVRYRAYRSSVMRGSSMGGGSHNNPTAPMEMFGEPLNWGGMPGHPAYKRVNYL